MPYYSYITSFNILDSSSKTDSIASYSSTLSGYFISTLYPYSRKTQSGFTAQPSKTISTYSYTDIDNGAFATGKVTIIRNTTSLKNMLGSSSIQSNVIQQTTFQSAEKDIDPYELNFTYNQTQATTCIIATSSLSYNPFKTFFGNFTSSSSFTARTEYWTNSPTTSSSSQSGTYTDYLNNFLYRVISLQETYTYTGTVSRASTYEQSVQSYLYLNGVEWGSTTYPRIENSYVDFTYTFSSTRDSTLSFCLAPQNITLSANLEFFLNDYGIGGDYVYRSPMLRAFFSTKNDILISDCDAVLNQTMSTSFTIAGLERSTGVYSSSPAQTISLTTNSIGYSETSTTRTLYSYETISTYQGETFYYLSSYTQNDPFLSYFSVSGIFTYTYGGLASSVHNSAYSHAQTITIPTTTSITDISCNIFSTFSLLRSLTISTTATKAVASQVFVGTYVFDNGTTTHYANPSFFPIGLYMAYSGFLTSSTQEILLGNFIKNVTDKTAYDNVNSDACAGIFRFTANGSRQGESDGGYYSNVPYGAKYHSYHNCTAFLYRDPLTSSIENVTINQNVSSFYVSSSGTSISQTINWMSGTLNSSTSRSFEVLYSDSRGTSSWTFDRVQDNDDFYFYQYITGFPAIAISPENIFATYGQGKNANYMAKGAYFKSNSSAFEFVTTTYPNPISLENYDNYLLLAENYSRISVFTTDSPVFAFFNYNHPLLMNISLRELY